MGDIIHRTYNFYWNGSCKWSDTVNKVVVSFFSLMIGRKWRDTVNKVMSTSKERGGANNNESEPSPSEFGMELPHRG